MNACFHFLFWNWVTSKCDSKIHCLKKMSSYKYIGDRGDATHDAWLLWIETVPYGSSFFISVGTRLENYLIFTATQISPVASLVFPLWDVPRDFINHGLVKWSTRSLMLEDEWLTSLCLRFHWPVGLVEMSDWPLVSLHFLRGVYSGASVLLHAFLA